MSFILDIATVMGKLNKWLSFYSSVLLIFSRYTSLLVDSRGTGDSEGPLGWWSMKDMAGDVVELMDKLEWTRDRSVHLVGHSMGGMMIQEIVSRLCESDIPKLILIGPSMPQTHRLNDSDINHFRLDGRSIHPRRNENALRHAASQIRRPETGRCQSPVLW